MADISKIKLPEIASALNIKDAVARPLAQSALQPGDIATGSTNGTISVDGTDISVKGLGSAAYTASSAYATSAQGTKADNALPKSGGTMTGFITLSAAPTADLHAATKKYVDDAISAAIYSAMAASY